MKTNHLVQTGLLTIAFLFATPVFAEPSNKPDPGRGPRPILTPEEREKLKAARETAMKDPAVQEAMVKREAAEKDFAQTVNPLLLAQDASLQPILDKLAEAQKEPRQGTPPAERRAKREGGKFGAESRRGPFGAMGSLTPEEREKLHAAFEKIKDNPEVQSAIEKRKEGEKQFREAMKAAMLAADPSLAPLLEKLEQARAEREEGGGGPGKPEEPKTETTPTPVPDQPVVTP